MTAPEPTFYSLPARLLREGMSTDDGQDILDTHDNGDGVILIHVYTPRPDDPELDDRNRGETEGRGPGSTTSMSTWLSSPTPRSMEASCPSR